MSYQLGKNITATVTYYDVMDFPLTAFEIWKHLLVYDREQMTPSSEVTLYDVWDVLHSKQLAEKVTERNGLYFLPGREILCVERIERDKLSVQKLKRMKRLVRWLRYVPYVRMIGATGSLSMKHGTRGSDWDMFVVLQAGKIWMGRTLLTAFLHLIGKRRHGKKINDRACLNYFVTDDALEIATKDLYSAHEYRYLIPLTSFGLFQIFELKNRWIKEYQPNFTLTTLPSLWTWGADLWTRRAQRRFELWCNRLDFESWLKSWQQKKISLNPKTALEGSHIEASDQALVFLPRPRGPRIFQQFRERLRA
ncbi:MAG: hypothetical protein KBA91_00345 [Candidatus Moranbacteria bacterium]|nr:hypothetical protein [Candidatus Moranbacteria bacterium]